MPNSDWRPYTLTLPTRAHDPIDFSQQNQGYPTRKPKHDLVVDAFVSFSFQKSSSQSEVMKLLGEILLLTRSPFVGSPPESSPPSTGAALYRNASSVRHQWQRHYPWQYRSLYRSETSQGVTHWSAWPVLIYAAYDTSSWPRLETTREPRILGSTRTLRKSLSHHKNLFAAAATLLRKIGLVIS